METRYSARFYVLAVLLASAAALMTAKPGAGQTATVTLVGAGDIASCHYSQDSATARLLGGSLARYSP